MISEQFPWLTTIILFPLLASIPIPLLPGNSNKTVRTYALAVGLLEFSLILYTFARYFSPQQSGLQLVESYTWVSQIGLDWSLAVDGLSMPLVVLSGLVTTLAILASWNISLKPRLYFFLAVTDVQCSGWGFLVPRYSSILPDVGN